MVAAHYSSAGWPIDACRVKRRRCRAARTEQSKVRRARPRSAQVCLDLDAIIGAPLDKEKGPASSRRPGQV